MAPITQVAAAACFAAFCSVRTAFAQNPTVVGADDSVYTNINLIRRGRMTVLVPVVTKTQSIVDKVVQDLPGLAGSDCANLSSNFSATTAGGFYVGVDPTKPNYAEAIQAAYDTGIKGFSGNYPKNAWGASLEPWDTPVVANIGYLLDDQSTEVGCGVTENCSTQNILLCRFNPTVTDGQFPFSKDYFAALQARTTKITDMSASDINPSGSGVTASFPSLLLAGFAGLMAFASI